MPFTVSHIAAVLPAHRSLRRSGLLSAAMIGSMVPDFGYLLPWHLSRAQTHSASALLSFCLPTGLLAWLLFQLLIKPAWGAVLPDGWRLRLLAEHPGARLGHWGVWLRAACAILAGALTHLVWDGFTHEDGRGVRMLPFLEDTGPGISGHVLPLYRWLQHGSSLLGLALVIWAAWQWTRTASAYGQRTVLRNRSPVPLLTRRERMAWLGAYVLPLIAWLIAAGVWPLRANQGVHSISGGLARLALLGLGGAGATLLVVSALIRMRIAALEPPRLDA
jgi:hypothetical protein